MNRGKQNSRSGIASGAGVPSRGPGVSSLTNSNKVPPIGNNNSSVAGAGFNSRSPYADGVGPNAPKPKGSLNTNVFNIPKYGMGGLGGGIAGSYGSGGLGGGIGGISAARLRSRESSHAKNQDL